MLITKIWNVLKVEEHVSLDGSVCYKTFCNLE